MSLARWNWLTALRHRLKASFSKAPPSKFTLRNRHSRDGAVEALEDRLQLSSASLIDGQVSIEVTGNDRVQVSASHGQTVVKFNGQAANLGTAPAFQVSAIVVSADLESSGTNRIDLSSVTASRFPQVTGTTISGGAGNDTIWGSASHDLLDGGTGNDYLLGRIGDDTLLGGEGNDRLNGGANSDSLEGDDGRDTTRRQNKSTQLIRSVAIVARPDRTGLIPVRSHAPVHRRERA